MKKVGNIVSINRQLHIREKVQENSEIDPDSSPDVRLRNRKHDFKLDLQKDSSL